MSVEDSILNSLGVDQKEEKKSGWLKDNGWTFAAWYGGDRRWHFFRAAAGFLRSACGRESVPTGTDLCESGWRAPQACRACLEKLRAEKTQPEFAL